MSPELVKILSVYDVCYSFLECNNPFYYKSWVLQTFMWISSEITHFVRYLFQKSKQGVDSQKLERAARHRLQLRAATSR